MKPKHPTHPHGKPPGRAKHDAEQRHAPPKSRGPRPTRQQARPLGDSSTSITWFSFIENASSGLAVGILNENPIAGAQALTYTPKQQLSGISSQLWALADDGTLVNKLTNFVLAIGSIDNQAGSPVITATPGSTSAGGQQWNFASGVFTSESGDLVLDGSGSGNPIFLAVNAPTGASGQQWMFAPVSPLQAVVDAPSQDFPAVNESALAAITAFLLQSPTETNIRTQYNNMNLDFGAFTGDLAQIPQPSGVSDADWTATKQQLSVEFTAVASTNTTFNNLQALLSSVAPVQNDVFSQVSSEIELDLSTSLSTSIVAIVQGVLSAVLSFVPGGSAISSITGILFNLAASQGAISVANFEGEVSQLWGQIASDLLATANAVSDQQGQIVTDWGKLQAMSAAIISPGPLAWPDCTTASLRDAMVGGFKMSALQTLLPLAFDIVLWSQIDGITLNYIQGQYQLNDQVSWVEALDSGLFNLYFIQGSSGFPNTDILNFLWDNGVNPSQFFTNQDGWNFTVFEQNPALGCGSILIELINQTAIDLTVTAKTIHGSINGSTTRSLSAYAGSTTYWATQPPFYGPDVLLTVTDSSSDLIATAEVQQNFCFGAPGDITITSKGGPGFTVSQKNMSGLPGNATLTITSS